MKIKKVIYNQLEGAIQQYVDVFCTKHDIEFDFWVADLSGGIGQFGDFFFNFEDVRLDLETDQPKDEIFKWYDVALELNTENKFSMNYYSWIKGARKEIMTKTK